MKAEEIIIEQLRKGKNKAVTNRTLQEITNLSRREVSATVHALREQGMIICSDTHGYYIPSDTAELISGYNTLWKKAVSNLAALKTMRAEIKRRGVLSETAEAKGRQR